MEAERGCAQTCTLHTVRLSKTAKILYPYHPLFGKELEVFGGAGGQRDIIYVRLPNNRTRGIPAWMFDAVICSGVRTEEQPTICVRALLSLSQLLDSVLEDLPTREDDNNTHLQTKPTSASAADTAGSAVGICGAKPTHPGEESEEVYPVDSRTTGKRCSPGTIQSERQR